MALYGAGEPVKAVAFQLGISEETAKSYLKRIREKYRVAGFDVGTKVGAAQAGHPRRHPAPVRLSGAAARPSRGPTTARRRLDVRPLLDDLHRAGRRTGTTTPRRPRDAVERERSRGRAATPASVSTRPIQTGAT